MIWTKLSYITLSSLPLHPKEEKNLAPHGLLKNKTKPYMPIVTMIARSSLPLKPFATLRPISNVIV